MTAVHDRILLLWAGTRSAWAGLDRRVRWGGVAVLTLVVVQLFSNAGFGIAVAVLAAVVWVGWTRTPAGASLPRLALVAVAAVALAGLGSLERRQLHDDAALPGTLASVDLGASATVSSAAAAQRLEPADPLAWELGGSVESTKTPTSRGTVDLERALILNVGERRASLLLAQLYLQYGGPLVNGEIAAYYTALAGYPAPPGPHTQR